MIIGGFQKLSLLDYPGKTSVIIFTQGCNYKCDYCQNSNLIKFTKKSVVLEEEILDYLKKRQKLIDGVVISGGEPTMQPKLLEFMKKIKEKGFLIKLDTNGSNPTVIEKIIQSNLVDYIAMDIKSSFDYYDNITKVKTNTDNIKESIKLIQNSNIDHEFRTTIIKNIHDIDKIIKICKYLGKDEKIYLQNFEISENVPDKKLQSFNKDELNNIQKIINNKFPNVIIRGL